MDFAELGRWIPRIERTLRAGYRAERRRWGRALAPYSDLLEEFALRGGKRFRALMVLAGYHLATGREPSPALPAAAAMEHFQSWMLIHDDIMDHAEERRGGPALHRALAARMRELRAIGDPDELGTGLGITLGDLEEPFTVEGILASPVPAERARRALGEYYRMARWTALGQVLDIVNGSRPVGEVREADVLEVHRLKSAVYTVASPLRLGATLGGATDRWLAPLERFGLDIGVAFQLRDDVLGAGLGGDGSGKSANDLVEGKRTLLVVKAWERSGEEDRARLDRVLGRPTASAAAIAEAREVIVRSGSLAHSEAAIERLAERAGRGLRSATALRPGGRALLGEIGDRLIHRSV